MTTDRRQDFTTAAYVREALEMQRMIGFEAAYSLLRGHEIDDQKARSLLVPQQDRRVAERRNFTTRPAHPAIRRDTQ